MEEKAANRTICIQPFFYYLLLCIFHIMSYPTNEPHVDFFVLCTLKIDSNIRNPLIFPGKMATFSCLAGPIDIKIHASMYFMSICPLAQIMWQIQYQETAELIEVCMLQFLMKGGTPLKGEVVIGGAKNAALGILAAL